MNERKAEQAGYTFHGAYGRDKDEIKKRAADLRALGNKAVMVTERDDKLSRGWRGTGYSVYWIESPENIHKRQVERKQQEIASQKKLIEECEGKIWAANLRVSDLEMELISLMVVK